MEKPDLTGVRRGVKPTILGSAHTALSVAGANILSIMPTI